MLPKRLLPKLARHRKKPEAFTADLVLKNPAGNIPEPGFFMSI